MDQQHLQRLVRTLRAITDPVSGAGVDDAQLLERFVAARDQAAFELLLWRHGPTVLGVCRRLLPTAHDAEDAFQATFLTLVNKAGTIVRGAAVGSWLYQVAYRIALRARADLARRARFERPIVDEVAASVPGDQAEDDLRQILDEEVNRLPPRQRKAFILCCVQGKTGAEAARELGCAPGTVSSRLTRARQRLRLRLARRGLASSASLLAVEMTAEAWAATLPPALVDSTIRAALLFTMGSAAGGALSAQAVFLTQGVLRAMLFAKVRAVMLLVLVLGALVTGGVFAHRALEAAPPVEGEKKTSPNQAQGRRQDDKNEGAITVQVVRPQPGGLDRTTSQPCTVQPSAQAELFPVVSGVLKQQSVDIGDRVTKGQLLAEIDAPVLALEEKQAAIGVRQAESQVREAEARVLAAKAEAQVARTVVLQREADVSNAQAATNLSERQLDRMQKLAENKAVDERLVEEKAQALQLARAKFMAAQAAVANAKADLEVKQSKVAQAEADLDTRSANREASQIALEKARYTLSLARVMAPFDGVVVQRNFSPGDFIRSGEQGGRSALLTVYKTDLLRAVVQIPERDLPLVKRGIVAELAFDTLPAERFRSKVSRLAFAADPTTHTMRVEIDFVNAKEILRPGLHGAATLQLKGPANALRVPVSSVIFGDKRVLPVSRDMLRTLGVKTSARPGAVYRDLTFYVYVIRAGQAHLTPVEIGYWEEPEVEVMAGLNATDRLVVEPKVTWGDVVSVMVK
jgi:RNA polymerase sigma factor (sigma-70 family)